MRKRIAEDARRPDQRQNPAWDHKTKEMNLANLWRGTLGARNVEHRVQKQRIDDDRCDQHRKERAYEFLPAHKGYIQYRSLRARYQLDEEVFGTAKRK